MAKSLSCRLRGWWWTLTMAAFWRSLIDQPPLVIVNGHVWPVETKWSKLCPSPVPEWTGLVQYDESACVRCGYVPAKPSWRISYAIGVIN